VQRNVVGLAKKDALKELVEDAKAHQIRENITGNILQDLTRNAPKDLIKRARIITNT
jgi:hypothetical protein